MAGTLVVAGLWARALAESAHRGGWRVIALDLFGDVDTRRASARWMRIGDPGAFAIDPELLREGLLSASHEPGVVGWVAGSGFEPLPEALDQDICGLPLLGMGTHAVRRVRDPACFFDTLDGLRLPHPEVVLRRPAAPQGWLAKSAAGCGGWHIRAANEDPVPPCYWQRMHPGESMSALFLADGTHARVVALNRQIIRPLGARRFIYHGAIGPIVDPALLQQVQRALSLLVPVFDLRGLASLDFLARDGCISLLEVNPRPSATMVLHDDAWPGGLVRAHLRAVQGELPREPPRPPAQLRGELVVFADVAGRVGPVLAHELAAAGDCHDLPVAGTRFAQGEPMCAVSATGIDSAVVLAALDRRAAQIRAQLAPIEELAA